MFPLLRRVRIPVTHKGYGFSRAEAYVQRQCSAHGSRDERTMKNSSRAGPVSWTSRMTRPHVKSSQPQLGPARIGGEKVCLVLCHQRANLRRPCRRRVMVTGGSERKVGVKPCHHPKARTLPFPPLFTHCSPIVLLCLSLLLLPRKHFLLKNDVYVSTASSLYLG